MKKDQPIALTYKQLEAKAMRGAGFESGQTYAILALASTVNRLADAHLILANAQLIRARLEADGRSVPSDPVELGPQAEP